MEKKIKTINLDPTLNWNLAEITKVSNSQINFSIIDKGEKIGSLPLKKIKWSISSKQTLSEKHKVGDIIFVKRDKKIGI